MRFDEIGQRIKRYEYLTTGTKLMPGLPVYARIDGRAFHTFCRGLKKPFCYELVETMQEVTKFLIEQTHAALGYVQSDEISLCWLDVDKAPFEGKLFKLESVLSSLATAKFITYISEQATSLQIDNESDYHCLNVDPERLNQFTKLDDKVTTIIPSFDCRVFQLPNEMELANTFIWREMDAVRNSVSMLAQANFSHKELQGKDVKAMITMLEEKGIRWNELRSDLKQGAYFHRVLVDKYLSDDIWEKIPENKRPESRYVKRSEIQRFELPVMKHVKNKVGAYFHEEEPITENTINDYTKNGNVNFSNSHKKPIDVWYIVNNTMGYETVCPKCKKKHYFSTAGDTILCSCGTVLNTKCISSLTSLDNYDTEVKEYSLSGDTSN